MRQKAGAGPAEGGANVEGPIDEERTEEAEKETLVVSIHRSFTRARPPGGLLVDGSGPPDEHFLRNRTPWAEKSDC